MEECAGERSVGRRGSIWTRAFSSSQYCTQEIRKAWEGFCTICICTPCGLNPLIALQIISFISVLLGLMSMCMGVWILVFVRLNASLPFRSQVSFEKLQIGNSEGLQNEPSFVFTPVDNLRFYFISISTIALVGGLGRTIFSFCLFYFLRRKKVVSGVVSWAWVILSMLAVVAVLIVTVDTLFTLSHNDLAPPHSRDFYFKNDTLGLYTLCHTFKYFILVDFFLTLYFQWIVRYFYGSSPFHNSSNIYDHPINS